MAATYRTLIGLLAVSGLRVGEAIGLDRDDVDDRHGLVRVIDSKFGKSREVPLHDSAMQRARRLRPAARSAVPAACLRGVLRLDRRHPAAHRNIHRTSSPGLCETVGLTPRSARCRPTLHDLRHRFAVSTLLDWHRAGVDVQARLPLLATYMGHAEPANTFWYLTAAPELLGLVAERLEPTMEGIA